jgi:NADPH-dependent ferric siderophore reductase
MTSVSESGASARTDHPGRSENEALAERLGVFALSLQVERSDALTPSCQRLRLSGDELAGIDPLPGQDLMISLDSDGDRIRRRRYTIRRFDRVGLGVDIDIALHGGGPGMRWATTAEPGSTIEALGPRGKVLLDPDADWHLFIGDDSFAPAALSMAEAVPVDQVVVLALEIDGPGHEQPSEIQTSVEGPRWVPRAGASPGDPAALTAALEAIAFPGGRGFAYIGGEHAVVSSLRHGLIERGMDPAAISHKSYWRLGQQNGLHGEPERA